MMPDSTTTKPQHQPKPKPVACEHGVDLWHFCRECCSIARSNQWHTSVPAKATVWFVSNRNANAPIRRVFRTHQAVV
jgi:hypothetical protein